MHICIPCVNTKEFVETAVEYIERFKPKLVIINSKVTPETTRKNRATMQQMLYRALPSQRGA